MEQKPLLNIERLNAYYNSIQVLKNVSICINRGELICLIGSNGAGKSSLMYSITGLLAEKSGIISFKNSDLTKTSPHKITRCGISLVPEERQLFGDLSVRENLIMGGYSRKREEMDKSISIIFELFPRLEERIKQKANTLSGGEQQMLAIARALMNQPDLLLLDEPSLGLAPLLVESIFESIKILNEQGLTIFLVEQNANMALSIASRGYVMETGSIVLEGSSQKLMHNSEVQYAYLGRREN